MLRKMTFAEARRTLYEEAAEESRYGSKRVAREKEEAADSSLDALGAEEEFEWEDGT